MNLQTIEPEKAFDGSWYHIIKILSFILFYFFFKFYFIFKLYITVLDFFYHWTTWEILSLTTGKVMLSDNLIFAYSIFPIPIPKASLKSCVHLKTCVYVVKNKVKE